MTEKNRFTAGFCRHWSLTKY